MTSQRRFIIFSSFQYMLLKRKTYMSTMRSSWMGSTCSGCLSFLRSRTMLLISETISSICSYNFLGLNTLSSIFSYYSSSMTTVYFF